MIHDVTNRILCKCRQFKRNKRLRVYKWLVVNIMQIKVTISAAYGQSFGSRPTIFADSTFTLLGLAENRNQSDGVLFFDRAFYWFRYINDALIHLWCPFDLLYINNNKPSTGFDVVGKYCCKISVKGFICF